MKLVSNTPRLELLRIELTTGQCPPQSCLEWDEFLHLYALLRRLPGAVPAVRSEVLTKLLGRGFEHWYATNLMSLATAGTQPLTMLVRQAAFHSEIRPLREEEKVDK